MVWKARHAGVLFGLTLVLGGGARGQWQVVHLHPEGVDSSEVLAAAGPLQGGYVEMPDNNKHPVIWNRSADDYVDLLPSWGRSGVVYGLDGPWQVGFVSSYTETYAALWSGSAESFIDLSPAGAYVAPVARGVAGTQQVGYAYSTETGMAHAALWYGSAETFVDLHPPVALWSEALATDGLHQGGRVDRIEPEVGIHAALWQGSPESFIDVHPQGAAQSVILAMADGLQVGWARFGSPEHAFLWRGSPDDYVDLHPSGALNSRLYDTTGTIHAGYANFSGWAEAGIWTGDDPDSFENLHDYLGPQWLVSTADAVSVHAGCLYVAGTAAQSWGQPQAILWMRRLPRGVGSPSLVLPDQIFRRP